MKNLRIGFIGNFVPPFSTENERKWSFEKLGHEVIPFQENTITARELLIDMPYLDVLFYSHTHGWEIQGLIDVFDKYSEAGKPTVSVHLDLWRGLERWSDVGKEATWFVEYLFMPDNTGYWPSGINVDYMRPGVVEKACYMAQPDTSRFPHEIIFVGSRGYHHEYPERPMLIDFLKNTYSNRFALYGGDGLGTIRQHDLNVLYASAKIVVGDSCFSQSKKIKDYYSDRIPETTGRGGFLLHPEIDCKHEGVVWFNGLEDLKSKIDYYLEHDREREELRVKGFEWTKKNANYTVIAREILERIFPND